MFDKDSIKLTKDQQKQQSNITQITYPLSFNKIPTLILLLIIYEIMLL